jgi:hypothetical protein
MKATIRSVMIEPCASIHRRASHIRKIGNLNVLLVPNALAAPFTFEKANCFTLIWIQKLVGLGRRHTPGSRETDLVFVPLARRSCAISIVPALSAKVSVGSKINIRILPK